MNSHKSNAKAHLKCAINKYGWEAILRSKVLSNLNKNTALYIEKLLRDTKNIGWNVAIGGGLPPVLFGENNPMFHGHTEASLKKMRGRVLSEDHKNKLSQIKKTNSYGSRNNAFKGEIECTNTLTSEVSIFSGEAELKAAGFTSANVYSCLSGRRNKHKNCTFKRLERE